MEISFDTWSSILAILLILLAFWIHYRTTESLRDSLENSRKIERESYTKWLECADQTFYDNHFIRNLKSQNIDLKNKLSKYRKSKRL